VTAGVIVSFVVCFHVMNRIFQMKRIAILVCGLVLVVANSAEARRNRRSNNTTYYSRPVAAQPASNAATATNHTAYKVPDAATSEEEEDEESNSSTEAATESHSSSATTNTTVSYSTATAQGVANLMARSGTVGHWGGNRGPEGCGCGATPAAAYSICCFANSGMATIDVGYARGANGTWYCCRRYR